MSEQQNFKCPCCGGDIVFDSDIQKMKCPYCDTEFEMETLKGYDEDLKNEREDEMDWEDSPGSEWLEGEQDGMFVYSCQNCGGEIVGDETTAATFCPYCDSPVVLKGQFRGELRPDIVIPFKLDKKAAKKGFKKHLEGKILLPKIFKSSATIEEIKGVYVPFWLFDGDADANIRYRATKVRSWSDSRYDYTETSFYSLQRNGSMGFEHVPVDGSSKMDDDLMESIEPFDFSDAVDFQTAYLSGYLADKYDVDEKSSVDRANQRIKKTTEEAFAKTCIGYTTVVPESTGVSLSNHKAQYALYPVWLLNVKWNDKRYTFAMNGQTGKFVGNLPMNKGAFWLWFVSLFGVFAAITFGICKLLFM